MNAFICLYCFLCGLCSGVVYDILYLARTVVCGIDKKVFTVKDKIFTFFCDVIYFIVFSAMFVVMSVCFSFYSLRLYMLLACALGAVIYLKSLHIIIAFCIKKVYNSLTKLYRSAKKADERRKTR